MKQYLVRASSEVEFRDVLPGGVGGGGGDGGGGGGGWRGVRLISCR